VDHHTTIREVGESCVDIGVQLPDRVQRRIDIGLMVGTHRSIAVYAGWDAHVSSSHLTP
jgi:hypothetical protein